MSGKVTKSKSKQAVLTETGKRLIAAKSEFELAFDQIKDIIFSVKALPEWKDDKALLEFRRLVAGVVRTKDAEKRKKYIEAQVRPWIKIFIAFKESILEGEFHYLLENDIVVITGKPQKAQLQLSKVYEGLLKKDLDAEVASLEARLCFLFKHLCAKGSDDRKLMEEVCEEYELEEDTSAADAIGNIVNQVKGKMGNMEGASMDNIGSIVQGIFEGGNLESMSGLAESILSGKMDIPTLVRQVQGKIVTEDDDE